MHNPFYLCMMSQHAETSNGLFQIGGAIPLLPELRSAIITDSLGNRSIVINNEEYSIGTSGQGDFVYNDQGEVAVVFFFEDAWEDSMHHPFLDPLTVKLVMEHIPGYDTKDKHLTRDALDAETESQLKKIIGDLRVLEHPTDIQKNVYLRSLSLKNTQVSWQPGGQYIMTPYGGGWHPTNDQVEFRVPFSPEQQIIQFLNEYYRLGYDRQVKHLVTFYQQLIDQIIAGTGLTDRPTNLSLPSDLQVTFQVVGQTITYQLHRHIMIQVPLIKQMLTGFFREADQTQLTINLADQGVDLVVLKQFLKLIYYHPYPVPAKVSELTSDRVNEILQFYRLADYFQLEDFEGLTLRLMNMLRTAGLIPQEESAGAVGATTQTGTSLYESG